MSTLPPLPPPYFTHPFGRELWHDEQMRNYAQQAVDAQIERIVDRMVEFERVVDMILDAGHMNQELLAMLRSAADRGE